MKEIRITIPLQPISKKNSSQILINPKTKKRFIAPSRQYQQYEKDCKWFLMRYSLLKIKRPVNVRCHFYMGRRYRVDLVNLLEAVDDVLVKYGVLEDDNSNIVVGHDGSRVLFDRQKPRTEILITNVEV